MANTRPPDIHRTRLTSESLRRLLDIDTGGHHALSMYLNFDPSQEPNIRERRMQASSLLDEAEQHSDDASDAHDERMALREDFELVRQLVADDQELSPESAHGLAIFCSTAAGLFEVVDLARPVDPQIAVDVRLLVEPLVEQLPGARWCVLLISHRASRVFVGDGDALAEVADVLDDVHGRHSKGGWSQDRYQRGIEKETDDHIRDTSAMLFERLKRRPFERLLIGGPAELHQRVEQALHADVHQRLAGTFEIDVERARIAEVRERVAPLIDADEQAREQRALQRLRDALGSSGHAAVGLDDVLELLNDRRVEMLLLAHGYTAAGFACPSCGRLSTVDAPCPLDGAQPQAREDVVEDAIASAFKQDAEVLVARRLGDEFAERVGALGRY
jgi:peptide subunit release factor 1 (eRF1)